MNNNKVHLAEKLSALCTDSQSVLVQLRSFNEFDSAKCRELLGVATLYLNAITDDMNVDRRVVGCLFYLLRVIEDRLFFAHETGIQRSDKEELQKAHEELTGIIEELMNPPI